MYDNRLNLSKQVLQEVSEYFDDKVYHTLIKRNVRLGIEGLIIDLRYNGGGLLRQATQIIDALLDIDKDNPILSRKGRGTLKEYFRKVIW